MGREFRPSADLRERVQRLRNFQSQDFWAMVFARPLTILMLIPVADVRWVTPDRITWTSILAKCAGIVGLFLWPSWWGGVAAALLLNLGLVLDNMDGTLARYRGDSSYLGYYLDKASDNLLLAGLFIGIAWRGWQMTGEVLDLLLPLVGFAGASVAAYSKWVCTKVTLDANLEAALRGGEIEDFVKSRVDQNPVVPPPERSLADWIQFVGRAFKSILLFNEVDIFFFLLLAALFDVRIFTRIMSTAYAVGLVVGPVMFWFQLRGHLRKKGLR